MASQIWINTESCDDLVLPWPLVVLSIRSHYQNQCWLTVNWTLGTNFKENFNQIWNFFYKWKCIRKWRPYCVRLNELSVWSVAVCTALCIRMALQWTITCRPTTRIYSFICPTLTHWPLGDLKKFYLSKLKLIFVIDGWGTLVSLIVKRVWLLTQRKKNLRCFIICCNRYSVNQVFYY